MLRKIGFPKSRLFLTRAASAEADAQPKAPQARLQSPIEEGYAGT